MTKLWFNTDSSYANSLQTPSNFGPWRQPGPALHEYALKLQRAPLAMPTRCSAVALLNNQSAGLHTIVRDSGHLTSDQSVA